MQSFGGYHGYFDLLCFSLTFELYSSSRCLSFSVPKTSITWRLEAHKSHDAVLAFQIPSASTHAEMTGITPSYQSLQWSVLELHLHVDCFIEMLILDGFSIQKVL